MQLDQLSSVERDTQPVNSSDSLETDQPPLSKQYIEDTKDTV